MGVEVNMDYRTDDAISKFRKLARLWLNIEKAELELEQVLGGPIDMKVYFAETEKINIEFETRRVAIIDARTRARK
jgi:hypothetical protein